MVKYTVKRPAVILSDGTIEIHLTQGYKTIIDAVDADLAQYNWTVLSEHAMRRLPNRKALYIHRIILERILGHSLDPKDEVDHKDGNGLNNRRDNLRIATHTENGRNAKRRKDNTSGFKGVDYDKRRGKWRAKIMVNQKSIGLGYFDNPEEGHKAYCEAAKLYHGEFARLE